MQHRTNEVTSKNTYSCFSNYENNLIHNYAKKLVAQNGLPHDQVNDIEQELAIALLRELENFDACVSTRNTFAAKIIHHKSISIIRKIYSKKDKFFRELTSLNVMIKLDFTDIELMEMIPSNYDIQNVLLLSEIECFIKTLSQELQETYLVLMGESAEEYCSNNNISRFTLRRRILKLQEILKNNFKNF